jgi:hypothetical protein
MNGDGSNKHQISPENIEEQYPAVSRDGRFMAFHAGRKIAADQAARRRSRCGRDRLQLSDFGRRAEKNRQQSAGKFLLGRPFGKRQTNRLGAGQTRFERRAAHATELGFKESRFKIIFRGFKEIRSK